MSDYKIFKANVMNFKINCKFNDNGAWCKHKSIKRSIFGIGARCCVEYTDKPIECEFKESKVKRANPPTPISKNNKKNIVFNF